MPTNHIKVLADSNLPGVALDYLTKHCQLTLTPQDKNIDSSEFIQLLQNKDALLSWIGNQVNTEVIKACPDLKLIANVAVGVDNIDIATASEKGILVLNTPNVLENTTADLAFALMLATARRVVESHNYILENKWKDSPFDFMLGADIWGKKLGIIGLGQIGKCIAKRAIGFDMEILYFQRNKEKPEIENHLKAKYASLEQLLSESDFVSLSCPLTKETFHLLGAKEFSLMKQDAILVNTARGAIIDQKALINTLKSKKIRGAGLDVFENEPEVPNELKELPNVVLTPHIGSATLETRTKMAQLAASSLVKAFSNEMPINVVNKQSWSQFQAKLI